MESADDLCPRPERVPPQSTAPHTPPIYLSSVYECRDPAQADALLSGRERGYIYGRDGHPNGDLLAEKCRQLHGAQRAAITSSGMAAIALVMLSQLESGDHAIVSNQLYGRTQTLLTGEAARLRIASTLVDTCDMNAVKNALTPRTKLLLVETISNPMLRVANLSALAELASTCLPTLPQKSGTQLAVSDRVLPGTTGDAALPLPLPVRVDATAAPRVGNSPARAASVSASACW